MENKLVYYSTDEIDGYLDDLENKIRKEKGKDADLLLDYPSIYVHVWRSKEDIEKNKASIYIGETNDIIQRTKSHWQAAYIPANKRDKGNWQHHLLSDVDENNNRVVPKVYFFGHPFFHKSLTLDIENRLIDFCYSMDTANIYNGRTNPQGYYYGEENFENIFSAIWRILRENNKDIFLSQSEIKKSAIFKASPFHKLTNDQKEAKNTIINKTIEALLENKKSQLIFVEGDAGTGKTVLTTSTFYELMENEFIKKFDAKCFFLIRHKEQEIVYKNIARKLGFNEDIVQDPSGFLHKTSILDENNNFIPDENKMADIVFIDESHLLLNQNSQKFDKRFSSHQIDEILKRSRVTVMMFDSHQMLDKKNYAYFDYFDNLRNLAKNQNNDKNINDSNYIELHNQLRMSCSTKTINWIDEMTKNKKIYKLDLNNNCDENGYEVKLFDSPEQLHKAIVEKANKEETQLSRLIATMDWEYVNTRYRDDGIKYWQVEIGDWSLPWNEQYYWLDAYQKLNKRERKRYSTLDWAEKDTSVNEVGTTFTIQGFDLAYAGVVVGPSVKYDKQTDSIYFDEKHRTQPGMKGIREMHDGKKINLTEMISMNELRVLMTRGTKGLYLYVCDEGLKKIISNRISNKG